MKPRILSSALAIFSAIALSVSAQAQISFEKTLSAAVGMPSSSANEVSLLQTYDGNYCVGGTIAGNTGDMYLVKLNQNGDTLWTRTFGGNLDEALFSIDQTADSGFILAGQSRTFSSGATDAYVIRTDGNGRMLWSKNYGGPDFEFFSSIRQTSDGGFIGAGATFSYGAGISDMYLVKLDASGNMSWNKTIGGGGWDRANCVRETFDHGFVITGSTTSFNANSGRIYLAKTNATGSLQWTSILGGTAGEGGFGIRQCADSGYIVTGYTNSYGNGAQDAFLLKTGKTGQLSWMKTYGGIWEDIGYDVEQTTDKGFIMVGRTQSFGPNASFARNIYLIKTNSVGDTLWTRVHPSIINNGYAVHQTPDRGYIVATWPEDLQVIKTDSTGSTPCNNLSTLTDVTNVTPLVLTGGIVGSGGVMMTSPTIARQTQLVAVSSKCTNALSVKNKAGQSVAANVYPNPFSTTLKLEVAASGINEFVLYNAMSQKLMQERFESSRVIDAANLIPGIYFYELRNAGGLLKSGKLVRE